MSSVLRCIEYMAGLVKLLPNAIGNNGGHSVDVWFSLAFAYLCGIFAYDPNKIS